MKATDYVSQFLYAQGVTHVYEVVGGMITHLVDSLHRDGRIRVVSVHHEQAAAFAADAAGRVTGVPGIAMATSGPGATNLLTGIGSCYFDSSPAVFITGQVNRNEQRGDRAVRQLGFQETDIVSMAKPITKAAWLVNDPAELPRLLEEAFRVAISGRPGPVLLDIPMDVQRVDIGTPTIRRVARDEPGRPAPDGVRDLLDRLAVAERPLFLVGGGIRSSGSLQLLREFVATTQIPAVHSLMAVDVLSADNPLRVGLIGSYGNRWANHALARADVLVVLGSRLDVRQTGADTASFKGDRTVYHVDCESGEQNNRVLGCVALTEDLRVFLEAANELAPSMKWETPPAWRREIDELTSLWPDHAELPDIRGINPNVFMHQLSAASRSAAAIVSDVGQHQMWAAQSLALGEGQRFLTSGGMGAMGFALPAAIGAAFEFNGRPILMIAGDGSFQLNLQELQTVARNKLPLKIVILNNQCHGMVRQFQQSYFEERYQSTFWGYSAPDFARVAEAYGIPAGRLSADGDADAALSEMWRDPQSPYLLEVAIDTFTNVYPKLAFGKPITEMEPFAEPIGMEST
jgi:acetolactate synthase-1/2/3 large subunit